MKLYSTICPVSGDTIENLRNRIHTKGLVALPNIGEASSTGAPLPMQYALPISFSSNFKSKDDCVTIAIDDDQVKPYLEATFQAGVEKPRIDRKGSMTSIYRNCLLGNNEDDWSSDREQACRFWIPPHLISTTVTDADAWERPEENPQWTPEDPITQHLQGIKGLGLDIGKFKDVAFYTFKQKYFRNLPQTFGKSEWDTRFVHNFMKWYKKVGTVEPINVSLLTHVLVNPPTPSAGIKTWGQEVECEPSHLAIETFDDSRIRRDVRRYTNSGHDFPAGQLSQADRDRVTRERQGISLPRSDLVLELDLSGPWEFQTGKYTDPKDMFAKLSEARYVFHGQAYTERNPHRTQYLMSCGSHLHARVERKDFKTYYEIYKHLTPLFAPFFAGVEPPSNNDDFNFAKMRGVWAGEHHPRDLSQSDLERWEDNHSMADKNTWLSPHASTRETHERSFTDDRGRNTGTNKPLTFEFRLAEGIPPSSVTAVRFMSRIAQAFVDANYAPVLSPRALDFGMRVLGKDATDNGNNIKRINQLQTIITSDPKTAEIISKAIGHDIAPNQEVNLTDMLKWGLRSMPLEGYETFWINNIINKGTWAKLLKSVNDPMSRMNMTHHNLKTINGWWENQAVTTVTPVRSQTVIPTPTVASASTPQVRSDQPIPTPRSSLRWPYIAGD